MRPVSMSGETLRLKLRLLTIAVGEELFNVVRKGMQDAATAMDVDAELDGTPGVDADELIRLTRQAMPMASMASGSTSSRPIASPP
ncbi:MAG: hypothetical protein JWM58_1187 [Rhizobium sp.]|nr:hypothetical protein [Rhizobium sp.]